MKRAAILYADHAEVPLTRGMVALIDLADVPLVSGVNWFANPAATTCYAARDPEVDGARRRVHMHRLIMNAPDDLQVDHRNGDGLDNRRANLRLCTGKENLRARRAFRRNRLGVKGVWEEWGKFRACIQVDGKTRQLGSHETLEQAASAYEAAAREAFGEFTGL